MSEDSHIPSPFKWSTEERAKYAMMAQGCPMCEYKYRYAKLQEIVEYTETMEQMGLKESDPAFQTMLESITLQTQELISLGLVIAGEQCSRNRVAFMALVN